MKPVYYLKSLEELNELKCHIEKNSFMADVIVSPKDLSRLGELTIDETNILASFLFSRGVSVFLEWDILMTQENFSHCEEILAKIDLSKFSAVRVQDIGAYHYLLKKLSCNIQLILESGNHNLVAIQKWEEMGQGRLTRIILGLELPKDILNRYTQSLNTPCEIQALGKILLFYSPRSLLSKPLAIKGEQIKTFASSEETPHKGFFVVENKHGTFMFLPKDQFLLDVFDDLKNTGVQYIRLDHRFLEGEVSLTSVIELYNANDIEKWKDFKDNYSNKFIRGYFNVNRSDAIFPKLKNSRMIKKPNSYLGKIVDVKKEQYLALSVAKNASGAIKVGDLIQISSPDGKAKKIEVKSIKNMGLEKIEQVTDENIVLIPHVGGICVKAQVHRL